MAQSGDCDKGTGAFLSIDGPLRWPFKSAEKIGGAYEFYGGQAGAFPDSGKSWHGWLNPLRQTHRMGRLVFVKALPAVLLDNRVASKRWPIFVRVH